MAFIFLFVPRVDSSFANVELLARGETFTDDSTVGRTVTAGGSATAGSTPGKFGFAYNFPAVNTDFFNISGGLELPGDFTVEFWATVVTAGGQASLYTQATFGPNSFFTINYTKNSNSFQIYLNTDTPAINVAGVLDSTFRHVALNREGSDVKLFLDGTEIGSTSNGATLGFASPTLHRSGSGGAGSSYVVDDLRITKGVARYSGNFTPPTAAHPTS